MNFPCRDKSCEWSAMLAVNSLYAIGVNWSHVLGPRFLISALLTGAKDCLPPGVEVPGRVAEPFDCLKRESFQRLPAFYSASVKIRCQAKTEDEKIYHCTCCTRIFVATGAARENLLPLSFGESDRLLLQSIQSWEVHIHRRTGILGLGGKVTFLPRNLRTSRNA